MEIRENLHGRRWSGCLGGRDVGGDKMGRYKIPSPYLTRDEVFFENFATPPRTPGHGALQNCSDSWTKTAAGI